MQENLIDYLVTSKYYVRDYNCFIGHFNVDENHIKVLKTHFEKTGENLIDSYVIVIHASWEVNNEDYFFEDLEMTEMLNHLYKVRSLNFLDATIYSNAFFALIIARRNLDSYNKLLNSEPRRIADRFLGDKEVRNKVFDKYGKRCLCCGNEENMSLDHVIPVIKGGENNVDNLQPLCKSCNSKKGTKIIDYRHG